MKKINYLTPSRHQVLLVFLYSLCLIAALCCYYFSISSSLFVWPIPDEIEPLNSYHAFGMIGCIKNYYLTTTINRLSSDFTLCTMAKIANASTPYMGWVISRLLVYLAIPASLAFCIKELINIRFFLALLIALLISTIALFVISDYLYIFSAGLAIYGTDSCYGVYTLQSQELTSLIQKISQKLDNIPYNKKDIYGMTIVNDSRKCTMLAEKSSVGEHYIATNTIPLNKGYYYFRFLAHSNNRNLFVYAFGKNTNLLHPWTGGWTTFGNGNNLTPIISQTQNINGSEQLSIILYSNINQLIQLRLQSGVGSATIYNGKKSNTVTACNIAYQKLTS